MKPEMEYDAKDGLFTPGKRRRMNMVAVCLNIFLPWFMFCSLFSVMSFQMHYFHPTLVWVLVGLGYFASFFAAFLAYKAMKSRDRDHTWYVYASLSCFFAVTLAWSCGDLNFYYNLQPFYDSMNMNTYHKINPATEKGQQLMDAGRVYFSEGTHLDSKKAMAFKNLDFYCVAPIVSGDAQLASYDFWAVGTNCCHGKGGQGFRCGEYDNPHARSGLRHLRDDQRPFFRLAVQQAEAIYKIKATHPLFFYWMQDPVANMNEYRDDGFRYFMMGMFGYFAFNVFCVLSCIWAFSGIGQK